MSNSKPKLFLPLIDSTNDVYPGVGDGQVTLYSNQKQLITYKRQVVVIQGTSISKKFTFDEDIVFATFTNFNSDSIQLGEDSLVVCLSKSAFIYTKGKDHQVSFPFLVKRGLGFESGVILEKDQSQAVSIGNPIHPLQTAGKFLSLVDPAGEFRLITSSSTSIISPHEELLCFPTEGLNKRLSLCATYHYQDKSIILYHIKSSHRNPKHSNSYKFVKRKNTFLTPNPNRILEDDSHDPLIGAMNLPSHSHTINFSVNMEKKRTSTLLSDTSSIARMGTEMTLPEISKSFEINGLRKDMILTRVEIFNIKLNRNYIDMYNLYFGDQEAIVIMNKMKQEVKVYIFNQLITTIPQFQRSYTLKCQGCYPLNSSYEGLLVILTENRYLQLLNPFVDVISPTSDLSTVCGPIKYIESCHDTTIALRGDESYILTWVLEPTSDVILKCLQCVKYITGTNNNEIIWMIWRSALMLDSTRNEWNALVITILSLLPIDGTVNITKNDITKLLPAARCMQQYSKNYSFDNLIPYLVSSLHLIREEVKLDILANEYVDKLGLLLSQLCYWISWPETWYKYYLIDASLDKEVRLILECLYINPPNILQSLSSLFSDYIIGYVQFSLLVEESSSVDLLITPRTTTVLKLFEMIVSPTYGADNIIDLMVELGISNDYLDTFPPGIQIPLKEAILHCQEEPNFTWSEKALKLVNRKDLDEFLKSEFYQPPTSIYSTNIKSTPKDVNHIISNVWEGHEQLFGWDDQSEADRIAITKLIFDRDRRYYEITTLLHQTRPQNATLVVPDGIPEYDLVLLQRELAAIVALRTLSIPLGRALLFYAGRMPLLTEKFPIPKFNLNTTIAPKMTHIVLQEGSISDKTMEWGYFHNGVASGLSISKQSKGITGSWVMFNKPPSLNAQHAGFLLGLGLNGHLKSLEEWHIYNYLGPKHPLTSVGLLLGMAASNMRSSDIKLTKVLSVHAVALLPQGANDLNVSIIVQSAGLLGIGLLYLETQHRRMSEILLAQITSTVSQNDCEIINEGYRLSAGIALGFINLGKGRDLKGLNDTRVVDKLLLLATSMKDYQLVQEYDKSCSGAIMALGFIHMKTEDAVIANKLAIPETEQLLDYIRPDLLLLRCVSMNVIMWSSIGNTIGWIESKIPHSLLTKYGKMNGTLDSDQIGFVNILGGNCLSMAIKYASTHDKQCRDTLIYYLDKLMVLSMTVPKNYDQRVACNSAANIQNLLALSVSIVMAGSGDLETFKRLRVLYGSTDKDTKYGNYMAISMTLGFLFLGGGQYAFGSSNLAIANLIISLYPVFPNDNGDYEVHLQALRHFWALSVEPRCLVIRDVETHIPLKIPVTLKLKTGETKEILTPYLLPDLNNIESINTKSSDHFKVTIDLRHPEHVKIFQKSLVLFVYKRRNHQLLNSTVKNLLEIENKTLQIDNNERQIDNDIKKVMQLDIMKDISKHEKRVYLLEGSNPTNDANLKQLGLSIFNIIDSKIELQQIANNPTTVDELWNLKIIFAYYEKIPVGNYMSLEVIDNLKYSVWRYLSVNK